MWYTQRVYGVRGAFIRASISIYKIKLKIFKSLNFSILKLRNLSRQDQNFSRNFSKFLIFEKREIFSLAHPTLNKRLTDDSRPRSKWGV